MSNEYYEYAIDCIYYMYYYYVELIRLLFLDESEVLELMTWL